MPGMVSKFIKLFLMRSMLLPRCIQRTDQPIILTGYAALNKLLGREVYTSHMQLGGPKVWRAAKGVL